MRVDGVWGPPTVKVGDRVKFVRKGEFCEGIYTIAKIDGLQITFKEDLPVDLQAQDTMVIV